MKPIKTKESILDSLSKNIPAEITTIAEEKSIGPSDNELISDSEEDYKLTRDNVRKLLTTSDEAIASMMNLASDSEHPRAFEVLASMIKTASDVNKQLHDIHKERKKMIKGDTKKDKTMSIENQNNAIFVGTTADLQKYLNNQQTINI